jgi:3-deoxy-manno-octulosonate cytidylyltransferase (CMP-KDO synthetase)
MGTLICRMRDDERADSAKVKAVLSWRGEDIGRALYFTRAEAPWGEGPLWHHIGIYAFRRATLEKFTRLPPSPLEKRERLEQLRALEAGMVIGAVVIPSEPFGVDTPEDLERAREILAKR